MQTGKRIGDIKSKRDFGDGTNVDVTSGSECVVLDL